MYSLDGIIVCEERISINLAPFASSFKSGLVQRAKNKQTTAQLISIVASISKKQQISHLICKKQQIFT